MMAVPKGLEDSSRAFNPGFDIKKNCALTAAPDRAAISRAHVPTPDARPSGATFRARSIQTINPGLKPWAESLSPFGTKHNRAYGEESRSTFQTLVTFVSFC
jgi:hypothetical protein